MPSAPLRRPATNHPLSRLSFSGQPDLHSLLLTHATSRSPISLFFSGHPAIAARPLSDGEPHSSSPHGPSFTSLPPSHQQGSPRLLHLLP
ncbi:hypothetical protein OIU74_015204 [Salix koriyanagi]|uniref:Uncharacterized protein n=1 Tax=Salix koriyanagi TaxID=2511006 RepID=A0A9Q0PY70_9ROSI|nr:hypothetical protein OIU74_015204 [Salix koriyanagi]